MRHKDEIKKSQAKLANKNKGLFNYNNIIPYSAEDFRGILYQFLGKDDIGEYQMAWFEEKLLKPYGIIEMIRGGRIAIQTKL